MSIQLERNGECLQAYIIVIEYQPMVGWFHDEIEAKCYCKRFSWCECSRPLVATDNQILHLEWAN